MSIFNKNIAGVELKLGNKTYIAPPMNFKTIIAVTPLIKSLSGVTPGTIPTKDQLYSIARIIHAALRRNYPFMRFSTVINGMDLQNIGTSLALVMGSTGAVNKGEAKAVNP